MQSQGLTTNNQRKPIPAKRKEKVETPPEPIIELPPPVEPPVPDPTELPGMVGEGVERLVILPLEAAADEVDRLKEKIADLKERMDKAVAEVRSIMTDYDITSYSYRGKLIEREPKHDVIKVKHSPDYDAIRSIKSATSEIDCGSVTITIPE